MKQILIIEDDPLTGHIYRTCLQREGYQVEIAIDGQSGFERLLELRPNGLLLDLMLPKTNGIELLNNIRALEFFQRLPVIAYTNAYVPTMIADALEAGATAVFDKSTITPLMLVEAFRASIRAAGRSESAVS